MRSHSADVELNCNGVSTVSGRGHKLKPVLLADAAGACAQS